MTEKRSASNKPNSVPAFPRVVIIHLGRKLPAGSSSLPGNAVKDTERAARIAFPYLALHREEFAWPTIVTNRRR